MSQRGNGKDVNAKTRSRRRTGRRNGDDADDEMHSDET
jgi:hypothetical protein